MFPRVLVGLVVAFMMQGAVVAEETQTVIGVMVQPDAWDGVGGIEPMYLAEYGSFLWIVLPESERSVIEAVAAPKRITTDPFVLTLGGRTFDPLRAGGVSITQPGAEGPNLHLIQYWGPIRSAWLSDLERSGLRVVQYIHPFSYVVWARAEDLVDVSHLPDVRWNGPFSPEYRVLPAWRDLPAQRTEVNVLFLRAGDAVAAEVAFDRLGALVSGWRPINDVWEIARLTVAGDRLLNLAAVAGVYSVQPVPTDGGQRGEVSNQVNVNNHGADNRAYPGYVSWLETAGVDGDGVVMANVDGGVQDDHPDLVGRILGCTGTTCGGAATDSHGTHTAGIMAADGSSGTVDGNGFLRGLGVAPGANLVEQVYSPFFTQPGGMSLLMADSVKNGASLSGNSWGPSGSPQGYDNDTMQVDIAVRDADPDLAGHQPLSYVLSIMNGYGGTSTQGTPDEAKNIFTIGSTRMQNPDLSQVTQINDLSSNSAHGPALDGRTIPHLVAPGCFVDSTIPYDSFGIKCGTSMASPHVSGAVALFIEQRRRAGAPDPSPALIKAAFLPVAHDLAGHLDADGAVMGHPFDSKQGWGRLDLERVIMPPAPVVFFDGGSILDETGEAWKAPVYPVDPGQPVRVMLVWSDAPGHGLGGSTPAWNNDLDLEVHVGETVYMGNVFDSVSGSSIVGGSSDPMNNTEGVFLAPGVSGAVSLRVLAANLTSDGVPGTGDATDQDFAVACYNCVTQETVFDDGFESGSTDAWN